MPIETTHMSEAYKALRTPAGRVAAVEGWSIQFWEFALGRGRAPQPHEFPALKRAAAKIAADKPGWPASARRAHDAKLARFERVANGVG